MKLLITFVDNKSINRFTNFLSVIKDHKNEAKGVILNFSDRRIKVVYYYIEEKSEEVNYFDFNRIGIPYFVFSYNMEKGDPTCTELNIEFNKKFCTENNLNDPDAEIAVSFRMEIENFLEMHKFLAKEIKEFPKFYFKAKTVDENGKKQNYFLIQADNDLTYLNNQFKVRTSRKPYNIIEPSFNKPGGGVYLRITMRAYKEIAEKWKNKLLLKKKDFSNVFLIKLYVNETEQDVPLYIDFIYNSKCKFTLKYLFGEYKIDDVYKFDFRKYYVVKFDQFIKVVGDYNIYNYNSLVNLVFLHEEILFGCFTNGITNEEKDSEIYKNFYSAYSFSLYAHHEIDSENVEKILESMD